MKLFVVQSANGNMTIVSEWTDNENGARQAYHNTLKNLYADAQTTSAYVAIFDTALNVWNGFREFVNKVAPEPEA